MHDFLHEFKGITTYTSFSWYVEFSVVLCTSSPYYMKLGSLTIYIPVQVKHNCLHYDGADVISHMIDNFVLWHTLHQFIIISQHGQFCIMMVVTKFYYKAQSAVSNHHSISYAYISTWKPNEIAKMCCNV